MAERLEDLYAELHAPIFRFLAALTGDPDAADELTQETFLQAILALPRFRRESSSTTWLYAIARNVNRKHMAKGRRPRPDEPPTTPAATPAEVIEAREERHRLARALATLPEAYREALVLREYQGLSYAQVGQVLGRSETWARVTCFRARQMLREAYLQLEGGQSRWK
ncbi:RNA polymerase sigma-70 factor (ECF subfamily) [Symbiobacterium terraclitae]|uniref:RNA polymerase sigma factor n=1 Tax=Symbiobacterium terraclitae TaxID=557451 RepID=A0ABS4JVP9_9FIRM|nr:RNA polymerase sigma factor [Symbiobacterium terraclitae]MBP2018499.1 RNA polymerase sigma-70 factor (ECF subfamily) [Symbiobacterium terraclitae]